MCYSVDEQHPAAPADTSCPSQQPKHKVAQKASGKIKNLKK